MREQRCYAVRETFAVWHTRFFYQFDFGAERDLAWLVADKIVGFDVDVILFMRDPTVCG